MRITNGILLTMEGQTYENGFVDFEDGVITAVGDAKDAPAYDGEVLDAKGGYIMPGLIDAHSHIGVSEEGLRWEGEDCNEATGAVTPDMRAMDGFYPFDTAIPKARKAGITTVVASPGSANVIGGQTVAVKLLRSNNVQQMVLKAPCSIKCAMGENPKRCYGESRKMAPMTRMATAAILRNTLTKAQRYLAKKEKGEDVYEPDMEALIPLLKREIPMHIHAHRSDDILTAIRIAKEFNLRCALVHATGSAVIAGEVAASGFLPLYGPSMDLASKPETQNSPLTTTVDLYAAGSEVCMTTDHPVVPLWLLPYMASLAVREGLDEEAALRAITINGAKAAGIEDRVGSLKVGKDADIVVFSGHPFHYLTKANAVFINGNRED